MLTSIGNRRSVPHPPRARVKFYSPPATTVRIAGIAGDARRVRKGLPVRGKD